MKVSRAVPTRAPTSARAAGPAGLLVPAALVAVLVVAFVFRFLTTSDLWLDEALTVNIAKLPLSELQHALRQDGAPPLYYVMLHGWIQVFGSGDVAVRAMSGVLGLVMIGLSYVAGLRFGADDRERKWSAWAAVLVVASSPYAIRYSTEARMYMLAMVLVLFGYLAVQRMIEQGASIGRFVAVALTTAALLYTQYWSLFLLAVVGVVMVLRAWRAPELERRPPRMVLLAMVAGGLLFLPWISNFLYQLAHTGTPWDTPATPPTAAALGIIDFVGGKTVEGWSIIPVAFVLALLALAGRAAGRYEILVDLRTVPGVRWEWFVGAATLMLGLVASYLGGTGFQARYAAVMYPLFALAVAAGILVISDHRIRVGVLAFIVAVGFVGGVRNAHTNRTQSSQAIGIVNAEAKPGDVVVFCPDQLGPDGHRLVDPSSGVREVVYPTFAGPKLVDWVDYADRNSRAQPKQFADRVLKAAAGHAVWVVWAPRYKTLQGQCESMLNSIAAQRPGVIDRVTADEAFYEFMGLRQFPAG
ncbi:MAG: glycosyltransferase family 39 protein [Acidimicrobiia bacterium]